ncbi:MAG TPA: PDZ domain-containing protein [Pirellulales bacterium]|jgi:membrane-associated protease RseP (regulator of RpoE activity)|nr:PDZ domain-containing protein [Pirellulales bacterium]
MSLKHWHRGAAFGAILALLVPAAQAQTAVAPESAPPPATAKAAPQRRVIELQIEGDGTLHELKGTKILLNGQEISPVQLQQLQAGGQTLIQALPAAPLAPGQASPGQAAPAQPAPAQPGEGAPGPGRILFTQPNSGGAPGQGLMILRTPILGGSVASAEAQPTEKASEYFLGLNCFPADAALRAQLNLPENHGLVVEQVVADGPAAKAGLKPLDILLTADGQVLGDVPHLVALVDGAKERELKITFLRGGKEQSVSVAPAKRPSADGTLHMLIAGPDPKTVVEGLKWLDRQRTDDGHAQMEYRTIGPALVVPPMEKFNTLPDNMTVDIKRTGRQPAEISVKQGDEHWEVTEKELDKLPERVRGYVGPLVGRLDMFYLRTDHPMMTLRLKAVPGEPGSITAEARPETRAVEGARALAELAEQKRKELEQATLDHRLEALQTQLEQMRAELRAQTNRELDRPSRDDQEPRKRDSRRGKNSGQ